MEKNSGSASVWKSLAVAFGDGLAFGVAVTLAQNRTRARTAPAALSAAPPEPLAGGIALPAAPEPAGLDAYVLEKIVAAVEARLAEQAAVTEKRLAEAELRLGLEIKSERHRDDSETLRQTIASLQQRLEALESGARQDRERTAAAEGRLADFERELPAQLGARIDGLVRSLESRFNEENRASTERLEAHLSEMAAQFRADLPEIDQRIAGAAGVLRQNFASQLDAGQQQLREQYRELEAISKAAAAATQAAVERTLADLTQALQQLESRTALELARRSETSGRETGDRLRGLEESLRGDLEKLRVDWQLDLETERRSSDGDRAALAGDLEALRQQLAALDLQFDSRIGAALQERLRALQLEASREQSQKLAALEAQLRGHAEAIARLRQKLVEADQGTLRLMVEIAQMAQARLDQIAEPAPAAEPAEESPAPKPPAEAATGDPGASAESDAPRFASTDANGRWRLPLMSGLLLAAMSLAWLRF